MSTIRRTTRARWAGVALALCALLWATPVLAAPAPSRTTRMNHPNTIVIDGIVYKPRVFIFVGKPKLDLRWSLDDPRFKRSFLERTLDAVWSSPL